jgi:hypothetical protein
MARPIPALRATAFHTGVFDTIGFLTTWSSSWCQSLVTLLKGNSVLLFTFDRAPVRVRLHKSRVNRREALARWLLRNSRQRDGARGERLRQSERIFLSLGPASQWKGGEPRDGGLAIGNRSRRWRPSPPHWYWRDPHLPRTRLWPKRRTQDRGFAMSEQMTPSSVPPPDRVDRAWTFDNILPIE